MTNKEISRVLKLAADLMEIHDENQFKIRTYTNATFSIERQEATLAEKSLDELESIEGIGKTIAQAIHAIVNTGTFDQLEKFRSATPEGVIEMTQLKGIGPKKIRELWKNLQVETTDQLLEACQKGEVAKLKGFGQKTEEKILEGLLYLKEQQGKVHYADAEPLANQLLREVRTICGEHCKIELTGDLRRKMEVIECIDLLVAGEQPKDLAEKLQANGLTQIDLKNSGPFTLRGRLTESGISFIIRFTDANTFPGKLMLFTGSERHLASIAADHGTLFSQALAQPQLDETSIYKLADLPYIIPELREEIYNEDLIRDLATKKLLDYQDIRGPFHCHSRYSDGHDTIRALAEYCIKSGYEYLGLSDHSKSAFYAGGLQEPDIVRQHQEIDRLNSELSPFRIFKGIESDILNDGSLDYDKDVLDLFDFVIASIHSNLGMDQAKATDRLIKAIENPYTTMLGHPTGRLLLKRPGYPIDHKKVIDACARNQVIIEINSNPWRLDLDWRWINYAVEQGVVLSINPDSHEIAGFDDMKYGIYLARKGGLTADKTFNTWHSDKVKAYLQDRKTSKGIKQS